MTTSTHVATSVFVLSMLSITGSASALTSPEECESYSLVWQSAASAGLGVVGTVTGSVAGGFIGGLIDSNPPRGGELVNDGATYGALAGAALGSIVGSTKGALSAGGDCATSGTFFWTVTGSTIAGAAATGLLLSSTVVDGDLGDTFGATGFVSLFIGPAIGALIGYGLNYPDMPAVTVAPLVLPDGGGGVVIGGRF